MHQLCVEFEWDPHKSLLNQEKHGIGFSDAQALWNDPGLVLLPSRFPEEPRYLALGKIDQTLWTAICTERGEFLRIISVRRLCSNK